MHNAYANPAQELAPAAADSCGMSWRQMTESGKGVRCHIKSILD
jgi:hypothetical protein